MNDKDDKVDQNDEDANDDEVDKRKFRMQDLERGFKNCLKKDV